MKRLILIILVLSCMRPAWCGEIRGKITFTDGLQSPGEVCVGVIRDNQFPYLSALMDVLATQKGVKTDPSGNYVMQNVPENVPVMVMADIDKQSAPSRIAQITLQPGEVRQGVDFSFLKVIQSSVNLKGKVTINGSVPSDGSVGTVFIIKNDNTTAAMAYFGVPGAGAYEFENVPAGNYTLTATVPAAQDSKIVKTASAAVLVTPSGVVSVDLNIQRP